MSLHGKNGRRCHVGDVMNTADANLRPPAGPYATPLTSARQQQVLDIADFFYMAFVIFISSNAFVFLGLHSFLWLMAYAYALMRISMRFSGVLKTLRRNWIFLLYPILSMASVLWSDVPIETARFSIQLTFTVVIAAFIGMRFTLPQIFAAVAVTLFFCIAMSAVNLNGALQPAYDHRNNFKGIFLSKNALGHRAVVFSVTCVFGMFLIPKVSFLTRLLFAVGMAINILLISISGSATAVGLSGIVALTGLLVWLLLTVRGGWVVVTAVALVPLGASVFIILSLGLDPVSGGLQLLGRDPTLTGRTVLWQFAIQHLGERPFFGYGASGFWNNPEMQSRIVQLQARYGDGVGSFHNLPLQLLIMLGPIGLLIHTMAMVTTLYRCMQRTKFYNDTYAAWALTITLGMYVMAMFGPQLFQQHALPLILVVAFGVSLSFRDA